ncbi:hypothetical protein Tco_0791140 [Tanacetum coccineum]
MELKTSSSFKTIGLLQSWQILCKIFSKCFYNNVLNDKDQPPLQIMQMMYCFVNNIHVDYAELLWEGIYYSLHHLTSSIPYPRFTKIIVSHYMTIFPEISRRARDMYHNLQDDDIMKNIFNSGRHKDKVGMQIPDWMITIRDEQQTRTLPESYARRSTRLTPLVPVSNVEKVDEIILQDTLQVSLAEDKSQEEQEARENVELVNKHLASEEIEKLVEGSENVIDDSLPPRNDEPQIPDTRLEPQSDKESLEVESTNDEEVEVTNVVIPVNVNEEEDEITDEDDPHDDAHPEGENSAKRQKTSKYEAYVSRESSSGQVYEEERGPSTSSNQEQEDDYDFWTDSYASDDDEIPSKQVSQDIMEEVSLTIDEAKLKKMADEMLRQRCTSGDEHQYHIDQMKNFLKSDIVWENPEAPALSLINQDLLYLKKGSSGPEKIVLSLYKFPAIIFNDDDIEERTSRWALFLSIVGTSSTLSDVWRIDYSNTWSGIAMLRSFGLTMVVAVCSSSKRASMIWALKKASPKVEEFDLKNSQSYRSMKRASTARANKKASSNILGFNLKSAHCRAGLSLEI